MKVVTHNDFLKVYTSDPAASAGRIECILEAIREKVQFVEAVSADQNDIRAVHTETHIRRVDKKGLYRIAALAAGGAIQAAKIGMREPSFALIRPPGHHASADYSWGFCYFNNVAIAIEHLKRKKLIDTAYILDFDLHYGDGTVSILGDKGYVTIHNPDRRDRKGYLDEVAAHLAKARADIIAVSAGFDNHRLDWGGLLETEDYEAMGKMLKDASLRLGAGRFAVLEGGYNHEVLGLNVKAFLRGFGANS